MMLVTRTGGFAGGYAAGFTALLLATACAPSERAAEPERLPAGGAMQTGLIASMEARYADGAVRFVLHLTNASDTTMALEFTSGQRHDFTVLTGDGRSVWTWSADRMFAQVLGTETLASGQTVDFEAEWSPAGEVGRYTAVGRLLATNKPIELRTEFEIPGR